MLKQKYVLNDSLHQLFDVVNVISVQGYDEERKVIYWNKGSELLYGYSKAEASGKKIEDLIIPKTLHELVISAHSNWVKKGIEIPASEITLRHKDGSNVFVFSSHVMFTNQYGTKQMYCIDIDLTDVRHAQAHAKFKELMVENIFEAVPDLFFLVSIDGTVIDCHTNNQNDKYALPNDIIDKNISDVFSHTCINDFQVQMEKALKQKEISSFEYKHKMPNGVAYFEARLSHLEKYSQVMVIIRDITEQHQSAELIRQQAYFDSLTLLPNRFLALDRLSQTLTEAQRKNEQAAVFFLDLDDFKKINDSLGHEIGDKLLIKAANRLQQILPDKDMVGRLGGDEFIVLLKELTQPNEALLVAEDLLKAFQQPFKLDGRELILTVSIGVAMYPEDGDSASDLLRNADIAMYQAKGLGRNTCTFFTQEMNVSMQRRLEIEEQMHGALERNEFSVYYQPQFDVINKKIVGAEALLRWKNLVLGDVMPDEFIPIAEHTGLIVPIGKFVMKQSLDFLSEWQTLHQTDFTMAVNLSPRQFRDESLFDHIKHMLADANVSPEHLHLEITEGILMSGQSYIYEALDEINELGIKLAMDDFGTGYSSLSYLRQYAFDILKIDRSFINGITQNKSDCDLVKATIAMSRSLGLTVIAEGVESNEQLVMLKEFGCDLVQGFYFSKPITSKQLKHF